MDPARKAPEVELRPELRLLAHELSQLESTERELVISVARRGRRLRTVPWAQFWKLKGLVSLGGNAVDDCKAVYDE